MTIARTIILAVGVALAGLFTGWGFDRGRAADRYVSVTGLAERTVRADLAIWPLQLVATSDDLAAAHAKLGSDLASVRRFLAAQGIDSAAISLQDFAVTDARANQYGGPTQAGSRFVIRQTVVVRSTNPDQVLRASQKVGDLVAANVVLSSGGQYGPGGGPTFLFTKINDVKPPMIAEATARARESAEQFARDSHTSLAGIRRASQGLFEILPRDQAPGISEPSQIEKIVRVVSTVEYALR